MTSPNLQRGDRVEELALRECPFCREADAFSERADYSSSYVVCNNCLARGPVCCQDSDEEDEPGRDAAITAWNERVQSPEAVTDEPLSVVFEAALTLCNHALDESRPDQMVLVPGDDLQALNDALDVVEEAEPVADELRDAGNAILERMSSTYRARNGREMGIQGDDGEKCWIVHSDDIETLRAALLKVSPR